MPRAKTSSPQVPGDAPTTDTDDAAAAADLDTETPPVVLTDPDAAALDDAIAQNLGQPPATESTVTLTVAQLQDLVRKAAADAVAEAMTKKRAVEPARVLPTIDEAKAQAEARIADGYAPSAIETREGWYVHPLTGANEEVLDKHLERKAKRASKAA